MEKTYQIKSGDNLGKIAAAQGVSLHDLLAANKQITNPDRVQIGQVINIPAPTPAPAAQGATAGMPSAYTSAAPTQGAQAINLAKLNGKIPPEVLVKLPEIIEKFQINTPLILAHFLAQCAHESGGFQHVSENLMYSAKVLREKFKSHFSPLSLCDSYAYKPEAIASRVYGSRMGNGDEASKEGWKYRGRGFIQLTGKENYTAFNKMVAEDVVANPELVAEKYPLLSAAWFFQSRKCIEAARLGATDDVVKQVTIHVNGGTNEFDKRLEKFKTFYQLLQN